MNGAIRNAARTFVFALLLVWPGCFLVQRIALTTADLGRHLVNGRTVSEFLTGKGAEKAAVWSTNYYSYTYPDYPAPNHHWGSGWIFYQVHKAFGFEGLSFFQLALLLGAWALMLALAIRRGGWSWACVWALWLMPVFAARREIRPEAFSVLFAAAYVYLFELFADRKISGRRLAACIAGMQIFWTNLHIYFVLGPAITAVYGLSAFFDKDARTSGRFKALLCTFAAAGFATFINPFGVRGALFPFFIFADYSYRIVENQSIPFLERLNAAFVYFPFFKTASAALLTAAALEALVRRRPPRPLMILAVLFAAAGWRAIRNFQLFALFALPASSWAFAAWTDFQGKARWVRNAAMAFTAASVVLATVSVYQGHPFKRVPGFGAGLVEGGMGSVDFFREEGLKGPIFNNYDIGGYLIYGLWPNERVFVDNRPEAYPGIFFKDVVVPAQENEENWKELDAERKFNVIFFNYHDLTPWAQDFMRRRLDDPEWAPVFADAYALIFIRRTVQNSSVILRRELPRSMFRVISNT